MKNLFKENDIKRNVFTYSLSGIIVLLCALLLLNIDSVVNVIRNLLSVLSPFLWGIFFAFIVSKFAIWFENILPKKFSFKVKRLISSLCSIVLLLLIIFFIISIIGPQLVESISKLSNIVVSFTQNPTKWINSLKGSKIFDKDVAELVYEYSNTLVSSIWSLAKDSLPSIVNATIDTVSGVLNFVIGFIVCLYILMDREKIYASCKNFFKAFLSEDKYYKLSLIYNVSLTKFYKFFEGKLIDSLIIGILCFIIMSILGLDFSMLISVIVGITNIIPFFGPFIGAVPSALILLMIDPTEALIFIVMILILQQVDGNVIGPKILGDSVGLSSLWIMFSIIVGGAYFGFFGMLLGVPVFSVIHYLVNDELNKKLKEKNINV